MGTLLGPGELTPFIDSRLRGPGDVAWRLEQLPQYTVGSDGGDYQRWAAGEPEPTWERKQGNFDRLEDRVRRGIRSERVRIFTPELMPYERFACEWGYALNGQHGEEIRVLHRGEHAIPELLGFDYWLLNGDTVVRMHYDEVGHFVGAENAPELLGACLREQAATWAIAEPFDQWYARHPELHQRLAA